MNVPASMRSGIMRHGVPQQPIHAVDHDAVAPRCPSIFAPHAIRKRARSLTSGSHAAPSMIVRPSAQGRGRACTLAVPEDGRAEGAREEDLVPVSFALGQRRRRR